MPGSDLSIMQLWSTIQHAVVIPNERWLVGCGILGPHLRDISNKDHQRNVLKEIYIFAHACNDNYIYSGRYSLYAIV